MHISAVSHKKMITGVNKRRSSKKTCFKFCSRTILFLLFSISFLIITIPIYAVSKQVIAAADFENTSQDPQYDYLEQSVPNSLITKLASYEEIKVVERSQLEEALEEMKLSMEGIVSQEKAAQAGKAIGATAMIIGDFTVIDQEIQINARLAEVETAEIIAGISVRGKAGKEIFVLVDQLSTSIMEELAGTRDGSVLPPVPDFQVSPVEPKVGEIVTFNASRSQEPDEKIVEWKWMFDGGEKKTGKIVRHKFSSTGTHKIKLTVADNSGTTRSHSINLQVKLKQDKKYSFGIPKAWVFLAPYIMLFIVSIIFVFNSST